MATETAAGALEIRPSDVLRQIHRLSTALSSSPVRLSPFQRRELEGALYALAWVLRHVATPPVDWMLPPAIALRVDNLVAALLDPVSAPAPAYPSFLERSQPAEHT